MADKLINLDSLKSYNKEMKKKYVDSIQALIGDLTNYWQYAENTDSIITAINQSDDWALRKFEQLTNKTHDIISNKDNKSFYPSVKGVADLVMPHIIYDNPTGFEASNNDTGDT